MTATTNSLLLKPHSPPCEELACLCVHLYLSTPNKNELPVVVNWICPRTASSPQNVLCHKWIKLSHCDVKIFNTASRLLGFREIPHCWCTLGLSSEGEKDSSFFLFLFLFVLPLGKFVCMNLWPVVPSSKLLYCVQNEWLWLLTVCHTENAIILIIRPFRNELLWHSYHICKGVDNSTV